MNQLTKTLLNRYYSKTIPKFNPEKLSDEEFNTVMSLEQPQINHKDIPDIDDKWVKERRLTYLYRELRQIRKDKYDLQFIILDDQSIINVVILDKIKEKEKSIDKEISFIKGNKNGTSYNIAEIKKIPMDKVFEINREGFFINNPLRQERSPSNSLHWNKKTNTWKDFGSGEYGDIIDMVMRTYKCDFVSACKHLAVI